MLLNTGHPGRSMYFIVSGTVLVQVAEKDKVTGITKKQVTASVIEIIYILLKTFTSFQDRSPLVRCSSENKDYIPFKAKPCSHPRDT